MNNMSNGINEHKKWINFYAKKKTFTKTGYSIHIKIRNPFLILIISNLIKNHIYARKYTTRIHLAIFSLIGATSKIYVLQ